MTDMREALAEAHNYIAADRDRLLNDFCTLTPERTPDRASMEDNERAIVDEADKALALIEAALAAPTPPVVQAHAPAVRVKALEWDPSHGGRCLRAQGGGRTYEVRANDAMKSEKQAAAQADYERRILSALEPATRAENEPAKKTMTLTLSAKEMAALEDLSRKKDLSPPSIFRQALKLYQMEDAGVRSLEPAPVQAGEPVAASFQARVQPWMAACFGPVISAARLERGDRLLEEVLELLQSGDYPRERIAALTDYVWSRPAGEPHQEVGGVMVTLAAYCLAHGLDMHEAGETELARIWTKVEAIRAKQAAKPTGSALPIAAPAPTTEAVSAEAGLEPKGCPTPGACSCPAPLPAEAAEADADFIQSLQGHAALCETYARQGGIGPEDLTVLAGKFRDAAFVVEQLTKLRDGRMALGWELKPASTTVSAEAVKVKPLEWSATGTWTRSDVGEYAIAQIGRSFFLEFGGDIKKAIRGSTLSSHPSLLSAQTAAQADCEARILSAPEPAPAQGRDEPVAFQWRGLEDGKAHYPWLDGKPTATWAALIKKQPDKYSIETRPLYLHPSDAYARGAEDMREKSAWTATSFLVGDPTNGVPLRSPGPHEIAKAIRALPLTEGEK